LYEFNFTISEQDYLDFNLYHMNTASDMRKKLTVYRLMLPGFFVLWLLFTYNQAENMLPRAILFAAASVLWFFAMKPLLVSSVKRRIAKMSQNGTLPCTQVTAVRFDDDVMQSDCDGQEEVTAYAALDQITVYTSAIYIYTRAATVFILPFSAFASESQKEDFIQFINEKIAATRLSEEAAAQ